MKVLVAVAIAMLSLTFAASAFAGPPTVLLHEAEPFAILAGAGITDVPTSTISGNVGLTPAGGLFLTGLTCNEVSGTIYVVDAGGNACYTQNSAGVLSPAATAVTNAYDDAAGRTGPTILAGGDDQLGGKNLVAGVYQFAHATTANLVGNLTLTGNADDVWIFQATSDFITAASSTVTLSGGAQACNIFWQVGSSATLHTSSMLRGTVLANTSIVVDANVTVHGRLLGSAKNAGNVTLISDTITRPGSCVTQASLDSAAAQAAAAKDAARQWDDARAAAIVAANAAAEAAAAAQAAAVVEAAAAAKAATDKALADTAKAAKAAATKAVKAATAAKAAAAKAKIARAAAVRAATAKRIKLSSIRTSRVRAGFTG